MAKKHKLHTILNLHEDKDNESLLINELARLLKRDFDRRAQKLGFTRAQWLVIGTLRRTPGLKQTELADILEVQPITVARTIDRMEKAGWVERRADKLDRRAKRLYLSAKALDKAAALRNLAIETRGRALNGIEPREHAMMVELLHKLKINMSNKAVSE